MKVIKITIILILLTYKSVCYSLNIIKIVWYVHEIAIVLHWNLPLIMYALGLFIIGYWQFPPKFWAIIP